MLMAISLENIIYLQEKGFLNKQKHRLLDIGPQNVYHATDEQIRRFLALQGSKQSIESLEDEIKRLVYFSTPRPEERTTLLSEVTDLSEIEYNSFDVCPALKTELLDLNFDSVPDKYRDYYDIVLNSGTTEHILNQWNCFELMHDATAVGGIIYCQLPASGYLDNGYFCYTPLFFRDLAAANSYEIKDIFFTPAGIEDLGRSEADLRIEVAKPHSALLTVEETLIRTFNIHAILQKTRSAPFRCALEIATAHAPVDEALAGRYLGAQKSVDRSVNRDGERRLSEENARLLLEVVQLGAKLELKKRAAEGQESLQPLRDRPALATSARTEDSYRLEIREGEETELVPRETIKTLLRESRLLREQAGQIIQMRREVEFLKSGQWEQSQDLDSVEKSAPTSGALYTPIYDYDGIRTDPRIIHNHDFMHDPRFVKSYKRAIKAVGIDYKYYWRVHVALWCAAQGLELQGGLCVRMRRLEGPAQHGHNGLLRLELLETGAFFCLIPFEASTKANFQTKKSARAISRTFVNTISATSIMRWYKIFQNTTMSRSCGVQCRKSCRALTQAQSVIYPST